MNSKGNTMATMDGKHMTKDQVRSTEEALDLALEALEDRSSLMKWQKAITAIKQVRSAPYVASPRVQEPVAWGMPGKDSHIFDVICPEEHAREEGGYTVPLYTTPPNVAMPLVQEPVAWMQSDEVHISLWKDDYHTIPLYTTPPNVATPLAAPVVPDVLTTTEGEHPEYVQGWNDCRQLML
jgi:hypothetical protein